MTSLSREYERHLKGDCENLARGFASAFGDTCSQECMCGMKPKVGLSLALLQNIAWGAFLLCGIFTSDAEIRYRIGEPY